MHDNHLPPPARPGALAAAPLHDLLTGYQQPVAALVRARHDVGEPEPVRTDALDALVCGQELTDRLMAMRWVTIADTLAYGASIAQVAAALGMDIAEVAGGLRSWADGQHQYAGMSMAAHDEIHALLERALHDHPRGEGTGERHRTSVCARRCGRWKR